MPRYNNRWRRITTIGTAAHVHEGQLAERIVVRPGDRDPDALPDEAVAMIEAVVARFEAVPVMQGFRKGVRPEPDYVRMFLTRRMTGCTHRRLAERHGRTVRWTKMAVQRGQELLRLAERDGRLANLTW